MICAGLHGIQNKLPLPEAADLNLYTAGQDLLSRLEKLPESLAEASSIAAASDFIKANIPPEILAAYCGGRNLS